MRWVFNGVYFGGVIDLERGVVVGGLDFWKKNRFKPENFGKNHSYANIGSYGKIRKFWQNQKILGSSWKVLAKIGKFQFKMENFD